jgi:hypothetical protein
MPSLCCRRSWQSLLLLKHVPTAVDARPHLKGWLAHHRILGDISGRAYFLEGLAVLLYFIHGGVEVNKPARNSEMVPQLSEVVIL